MCIKWRSVGFSHLWVHFSDVDIFLPSAYCQWRIFCQRKQYDEEEDENVITTPYIINLAVYLVLWIYCQVFWVIAMQRNAVS